MEYRPDAYEINENPSLVAVVKVKKKNPQPNERTHYSCVKCQLMDKDKKMKSKFSKVKDGLYEEVE